jgi:fused signal recognition particle receptor
MFDKLRERLNDFRKSIDDKLGQPTEAEKHDAVPEARAGVLDRAAALARGEVILSEKDLEGPLWELEMALLESDVALPVAESIIDRIKKDLSGQHKRLLSSTGDIAEDALRDSILSILSTRTLDFEDYVKNHEKPVTVVFTGVNGTGKTTTIAKLAELLKEKKYGVVIAAGDTFRAGAIEQLEKHAERLNIKMIKHQQGSDPAAVIYDAVAYARSNKKDVVLADTAGRLHTAAGLMDELEKVKRVISRFDATAPHETLLVLDASQGQNALAQALRFHERLKITGLAITKLDGTAKGGILLAVARALRVPIRFVAVGEGVDDLDDFRADEFVRALIGERAG